MGLLWGQTLAWISNDQIMTKVQLRGPGLSISNVESVMAHCMSNFFKPAIRDSGGAPLGDNEFTMAEAGRRRLVREGPSAARHAEPDDTPRL